MHIPDGFVSSPVNIATIAASVGFLGYALLKSKNTLNEKQTYYAALCGAYIFAMQMINVNVTHGTSGHFLGAALAAILFGPFVGMLILTTVLVIQCLFFGDGGALALGSNVLNMAVIGCLLASVVYTKLSKTFADKPIVKYLSMGLAAWVSVVAASLACTIEILLSNVQNPVAVLEDMLRVHSIIGIPEAVITIGTMFIVYSINKEFKTDNNKA